MGQLTLLQALTTLVGLFAITSGLPSPAESGDVAGSQQWDPNRFKLARTPEGKKWGQISEARIREKLGLDDPNLDPKEADQRWEDFDDCMNDEFLARRPEEIKGPTADDYLYLPWGVDNLEKFMPIEDWCVGEALGDPRMARSRTLREEFEQKIYEYLVRRRQRVRAGLPADDPNDPRPKWEPQAPKVVEMSLGGLDDGGRRRVKQSSSTFDAGRTMKDMNMAYNSWKLNAGRQVKDTVQRAPDGIKKAALGMVANKKGSSPWKIPAFNGIRGGGGLPVRMPV
ncbi:MAG: hypothetical protein M1823_003452 [Watsoniomyces obsoletus]|nr:MAG: hypothetical protein M1823_003452 [Watsoniomyces obsoletus]